MSKPFLRNTSEISLLENETGQSLRIISSNLTPYVMNNNNDYLNRCISTVPNGKDELRKMLDDVRKIIFTKEDLIRWFHKIKEDAVNETDMIIVSFKASSMSENQIDFERIGFLSGIYEESRKYLNLMIAIEPLDENKAHYSVLDRLEELDNLYINTDNIPGYYCIQQDSKIHKHKYQIKNLDQYWNDYLSIKEKHHVLEGFGDTRYLLDQFHFEFKWELIKIKPLSNIKQYLDYHLKKYIGSPIDFLNHIEFRIMPELDSVSGSDYPIYQLILKEWLKSKRNGLIYKEKDFLFDSIISASATFLDNVFEYKKMSDENKYNIVIRDFLNHSFRHKKWHAKDQSMGGTTDSQSSSNKAGISFRDLIIINENMHHISAVECLRLYSVPKEAEKDSVIKSHLIKIFRNEPIGLSPLFILIYCETKEFTTTWKKYIDYISQIDFGKYQNITCEDNYQISPSRANLKVAKVKHIRETNVIEVYHIFINMNP